MNITKKQIDAIERGEVVPITFDTTECVIIRREIFEKAHNALSVKETYPAVLEALDDESPDQYLEYLK